MVDYNFTPRGSATPPTAQLQGVNKIIVYGNVQGTPANPVARGTASIDDIYYNPDGIANNFDFSTGWKTAGGFGANLKNWGGQVIGASTFGAVSLKINYEGFSSRILNAHIHGPGDIFTNTATKTELSVAWTETQDALTGLWSGTIAYVSEVESAAEQAALLGNKWYVNVHTINYNLGSINGIRANALTVPEPPINYFVNPVDGGLNWDGGSAQGKPGYSYNAGEVRGQLIVVNTNDGLLELETTNTEVVLKWPETLSPEVFKLQSATNSLSGFMNVPAVPSIIGGKYQVTESLNGGAKFFRLKSQTQ
jgi:hypothetical protein